MSSAPAKHQLVMNMDSLPDDKGLSTRQLILIFLAGVAVCGVFFSLGFLVGFNERSTRVLPVAEHVSTPATVPPTINPPLETVPVGPGGAQTSSTSVPPPLSSAQAGGPPTSSSEQQPATASGTALPVAASGASQAGSAGGPEADGAATSTAEAGQAGGGFTVQVTALRTKQDAEGLVKILKGRGYPVFLVAPEHARARDNLYRVQVGPFGSRNDAEKVRAKLTQEGFKPFIRR